MSHALRLNQDFLSAVTGVQITNFPLPAMQRSPSGRRNVLIPGRFRERQAINLYARHCRQIDRALFFPSATQATASCVGKESEAVEMADHL
jgi:hypothetical protein